MVDCNATDPSPLTTNTTTTTIKRTTRAAETATKISSIKTVQQKQEQLLRLPANNINNNFVITQSFTTIFCYL